MHLCYSSPPNILGVLIFTGLKLGETLKCLGFMAACFKYPGPGLCLPMCVFCMHLFHLLFLYLWLFVTSILSIMGAAVLSKAMKEFALNSMKGSGDAKCGKFHLLNSFYKHVYTSVSGPNLL